MGITCFIVNKIWVWSNIPKYRRFAKNIKNPKQVQERYLCYLLKRNSQTEYGQRYDFKNISSSKEYQNKVPVTEYEDYLPYIDRIGKKKVLTAEDIILLEPSSGTVSASKLIPYTKGLKKEFQNAIAPWIVSLYQSKPQLLKGKAYWSISPKSDNVALKKRSSVKIGFEEDAEYLGFLGNYLYSKISAIPKEVSNIKDIEQFKKETLHYLTSCQDLCFISVWSPTFLLTLIDEVKNQNIFPNLSVISCWTEGASKPYADKLKEYFPNVEIQGKGLIATEAFVSFPFLEGYDPILAINSHFFEFEDVKTREIKLANEVEVGNIYSVIVSTSGGLYRYRLGDLVEITGFIEKTPCMKFVSKEGVISDIVGEKLNSLFIKVVLEKLFEEFSLNPNFFILAPFEDEKGKISYVLFIEEKVSSEILIALENKLLENFHYKYARKMGQLEHIKLFIIQERGMNSYINEMQKRNIKIGDIKPSVLDTQMGWESIFSGKFIN